MLRGGGGAVCDGCVRAGGASGRGAAVGGGAVRRNEGEPASSAPKLPQSVRMSGFFLGHRVMHTAQGARRNAALPAE